MIFGKDEPLSILRTDVDCNEAMKELYAMARKTTGACAEIAANLPPLPPDESSLPKFNATVGFMGFHYLQLIPILLNANTHASLRSTDLLVQLINRTLRLERLTEVLIVMTAVLIALTVFLLLGRA